MTKSIFFDKSILLGMTSIFILDCSPMKKENGTITMNNTTDRPVYNVNFEFLICHLVLYDFELLKSSTLFLGSMF